METVGLVNERLKLLTAGEYARMARLGVFARQRVELLHGRVVELGPMGEEHGWVIQRLTMVLVEAFGAVADVRVQLPVLASEDSMPEPDFLLVPRTSRPGAHPRQGFLVIEVADTSLRFDRVVKAPLYAAGPAPEYWIVDLRRGALEVHRRPRRGAYSERLRLGRDDVVSPVAFPGVELKVRALLPPPRRR